MKCFFQYFTHLRCWQTKSISKPQHFLLYVFQQHFFVLDITALCKCLDEISSVPTRSNSFNKCCQKFLASWSNKKCWQKDSKCKSMDKRNDRCIAKGMKKYSSIESSDEQINTNKEEDSSASTLSKPSIQTFMVLVIVYFIFYFVMKVCPHILLNSRPTTLHKYLSKE